jgi:hypothetical protein
VLRAKVAFGGARAAEMSVRPLENVNPFALHRVCGSLLGGTLLQLHVQLHAVTRELTHVQHAHHATTPRPPVLVVAQFAHTHCGDASRSRLMTLAWFGVRRLWRAR